MQHQQTAFTFSQNLFKFIEPLQIIKIFMFDEKVLLPNQFPVQERDRKSTDVCCTIISAILPIALFIAAWSHFNRDNLSKNFSLSSEPVCQNGQVSFIANPAQPQATRCVNECPAGFFAKSSICIPQNDDLKQSYFNIPSVSNSLQNSGFKSTLIWSLLSSLGLGLLWLLIQFCFPKIAATLAHVLGALSLLALGILLFVLGDRFWGANSGLKVILAILCFLAALILIVMLCFYANERKFQGFMLDYSKRFLTQRPHTLLYLPLFILFGLGLTALTLWQGISFASSLGSAGSGIWNLLNGGFWSFLNLLQFIWGIQFLRDAYNFVVSGSATDWYWNRPQNTNCYTPYQRLLCKHWGSVVGGSFLNALFGLLRSIVELFICHPQACCPALGSFCYNSCSWYTCFWDLIRTDAYSYQNISGIPFCNSARQAKKINEANPAYIGSHSPMNRYNFVSKLFLVPLSLIISWMILRTWVPNPNIWHWIILTLLNYLILSFFTDFFGNAAEGLQTSFLAERELQNGNFKFMQKLLPSFKTPLEHIEKRIHGEGDGYL